MIIKRKIRGVFNTFKIRRFLKTNILQNILLFTHITYFMAIITKACTMIVLQIIDRVYNITMPPIYIPCLENA